jgi:hypothetical protein
MPGYAEDFSLQYVSGVRWLRYHVLVIWAILNAELIRESICDRSLCIHRNTSADSVDASGAPVTVVSIYILCACVWSSENPHPTLAGSSDWNSVWNWSSWNPYSYMSFPRRFLVHGSLQETRRVADIRTSSASSASNRRQVTLLPVRTGTPRSTSLSILSVRYTSLFPPRTFSFSAFASDDLRDHSIRLEPALFTSNFRYKTNR